MSTLAQGLVEPLIGPPRAFDAVVPEQPDPALRERLAALRERYAAASPEDLLAGMIAREFPGTIAVASSFGAESAVVLHMVARLDPTVPVIFLNTAKLFPETLHYRDELQERLGLTDLRAAGPHPDQLAAADPDGTLWSRNTDRCCHLRKVLPLRRALGGFAAQVTGRKRFQTAARLQMPRLELDGSMFKINPLADFSQHDIEAYMATHHLPRHPLVAAGFPSIGCAPCTRRVGEGEDYRAGRWSGSDKVECGIHTYTEGGGI